MAKYDGWTFGEAEALLNKIGGTDVARAVLRGERKLTVEGVVPQQPTPIHPRLIGTLFSKIRVNPYQASSTAKAIKLGKYDKVGDGILDLFGKEEAGLTEAVNIDLYRFDQAWCCNEVLAWAKENGNRKPILLKHLLGIGIQYPAEQRYAPIMETGSVRQGNALHLYADSDGRYLTPYQVNVRLSERCLIGFLSE